MKKTQTAFLLCLLAGAGAAWGANATDAGSATPTSDTAASAPAAKPKDLLADTLTAVSQSLGPGAVELAPYTVTAPKEEGGQTSMRMDVPVQDVPATVQVVSSEDLAQHDATDFVSALDYTPGVFALSQYGGLDSANVRGLPSQYLTLLNDGVPDDTINAAGCWPQGNLAGVESLQLLKGPASMLYGSGALAGVLNIVHTQPSDTPVYDADLGYGSYNTRDLALGAGGPLGTLPLLYRLDVASHSTDGFRQDPENGVSASFGLEAKPWDGFTISYRGDIDHNHISDPDPGVPVGANNQISNAVPLNLNYGNPNDFIDLWAVRNALTFRQDLGSHFYVSTLAAYQVKDYEYLESEQLTLQADQQTVNRSYLWFEPHYNSWLSQTEAGWKFDGAVPQQGLVGYAFEYWQYGTAFDSNLNYNPDPTDNVNLYAGGMGSAPVISINPDSEQWDSQFTNGVYAQDYLTLQPWAKLLLAGRFSSYSRYENTDTLASGGPESGEAFDTYNSGSVTKTANSAPTWRVGLVLSPLDWLNAYATYTTAFIPVFENDSATGNNFLPETGSMVETGLKWASHDGRNAGTIAWFNEQVANLIYQVGTDPGLGSVYSQNDDFSAQGLDLSWDSMLTSNFRIKGGYTYTDARQNSFNDPGFVNGRPAEVPANQGDVWGILGLGRGFSLGLGGRYVGLTYADAVSDQVAIPAYAVADAGLYYQVGKSWGVNLVVNNLFNLQRYFVSSIVDSQAQLYPGQPLTTDLSTHFSF